MQTITLTQRNFAQKMAILYEELLEAGKVTLSLLEEKKIDDPDGILCTEKNKKQYKKAMNDFEKGTNVVDGEEFFHSYFTKVKEKNV